MSRNRVIALVVIVVGLALAGLIIWRLVFDAGPAIESGPYIETFDSAGTWTVGQDAEAEGQIRDGVYEMVVELSGDIFWVTAGHTFANGTYQVEATPLEGTEDNGYGLLLRVDDDEAQFYMFKVSSDGYVFIGRCEERCAETEALVGQDWFASPAVAQGFGVTNRLRVTAEGPQMTFFVNETEVGQVVDQSLSRGDVGLLAETFAPGGLRVTFDNLSVRPLEDAGS